MGIGLKKSVYVTRSDDFLFNKADTYSNFLSDVRKGKYLSTEENLLSNNINVKELDDDSEYGAESHYFQHTYSDLKLYNLYNPGKYILSIEDYELLRETLEKKTADNILTVTENHMDMENPEVAIYENINKNITSNSVAIGAYKSNFVIDGSKYEDIQLYELENNFVANKFNSEDILTEELYDRISVNSNDSTTVLVTNKNAQPINKEKLKTTPSYAGTFTNILLNNLEVDLNDFTRGLEDASAEGLSDSDSGGKQDIDKTSAMTLSKSYKDKNLEAELAEFLNESDSETINSGNLTNITEFNGEQVDSFYNSEIGGNGDINDNNLSSSESNFTDENIGPEQKDKLLGIGRKDDDDEGGGASGSGSWDYGDVEFDTYAAEINFSVGENFVTEGDGSYEFNIELSEASTTDTVIEYSVSGDAAAGMDFESLSGELTIYAGQTEGTIEINLINDNLVEGDESFSITIDNISFGNSKISLGDGATSTITIVDTDTADVTVIANDGTSAESGDAGGFTVQLSQAADTDTVISYSVDGDAVAGTDYTALSGEVVIKAGETSATIEIEGIEDSLLEDNESITISLDEVTSGDKDIAIGNESSDTLTLYDNDSAEVSITANDDSAGEGGNAGQFTVSLSKAADVDTVVSYTVGGDAQMGSDYEALSGEVVIKAGDTSATIDVTALEDNILESDESITLTLDNVTSGDENITIGGDNSSTINLVGDNDSAEVSITANDDSAGEGGNAGQFTVSLSKAADVDTVVSYTVGGDAQMGSDYEALSGEVVIKAGDTSATIDVTALEDNILESDESITLTLDNVTSGDENITIGGDNSSTINLVGDNDSAEVSLTTSEITASEDGGGAIFTVNISNASDSDTVLSYTLGGDATMGDDFSSLTGEVVIKAGDTSADINIDFIDDNVLEDSESLSLTLDNITSGDSDVTIGDNNTSTLNLVSDNDEAEVSLTTTNLTASEDGGSAVFTVNMSKVADTDTVVSYTVGGDATMGDDFSTLSGEVVIKAGESTASIELDILDDDILEGDETISLTLDEVISGDNDITINDTGNTSVVNLSSDNDSAELSISATNDYAIEGGDNGQFTVNLSQAADTDTVISYTIDGDATMGADYQGLSGEVVIQAGDTSAVIDINVIDDNAGAFLTGGEVIDLITNGEFDTLANGNGDGSGEVLIDSYGKISDYSAINGWYTNEPIIQIHTGASGGMPAMDINDNVLDLDSDGPDSNTTVSQDVTVVDDGVYTLSFDYSGRDAGDFSAEVTSEFNVMVDGVIVQSYNPSMGFNTESIDVILSEGSHTVSFQAQGPEDSYGAIIDGVSLTKTTYQDPVDPNNQIENTEQVTLTLDNITQGDQNISIGSEDSASVSIADNETAEVSLMSDDFTNSFAFVMDTRVGEDVLVNYTISGDADMGVDFSALSGSITIEAGDTDAVLSIDVLSDNLIEFTETLTLTIDDIVYDNGNIVAAEQNTADIHIWGDNQEQYNTVYGTSSDDIINGQAGKDLLGGSQYEDTGAGDDVLNGYNGDDIIYGGDGDDTLNGGAGNDDLFGGDGLDSIFGDDGNDKFYDVQAGDNADGGTGDDVFHYQSSNTQQNTVWINGGDNNDTLNLGAESNWSILFDNNTELTNVNGNFSGSALGDVSMTDNNSIIELDVTGSGSITVGDESIVFTDLEFVQWQ